MKTRYYEFLKFALVGIVTFFIDYSTLFILTEYSGLNYLMSSAISFSISVLINYVLCLLFVFDGARNGWKQIALFVLSSIIGLCINQICMWLLVAKLAIYYMVAKILATIAVMFWNYVAKKKSLQI